MNVKQVKRSIGVITSIRDQTASVMQRVRKAEVMFENGCKELDAAKTELNALAIDLAGHATTYLYHLQLEEAKEQPKEEVAA